MPEQTEKTITEAGHARLVRWLLLLAVLAAAFVLSANRLVGTDWWWHVRTGEYIVEHARVPRYNPFSFTAGGHRWVDQSWISQIIFYRVDEWFGHAGLVLLRAMLMTSAVALALLAARGRRVPLGLSAALALLAAVQLQKRSLVRPFLFSFIFFLIIFVVLDWLVRRLEAQPVETPEAQPAVRPRRLAMIAAGLCALVWLWANVHAAFPLGLALIGLFGLRTAIVAASWKRRRLALPLLRSEPVRVLAVLILTWFAALLLTFVNPNGVDLWRYVFQMRYGNVLVPSTWEFRPMRWVLHMAPFWVVALTWLPVLVLSVGLRWIGARRRMPPIPLSMWLFDVILAVTWTVMAIQRLRHLGYVMLLAVPIYGFHLTRVFRILSKPRRPWRPAIVTGLHVLILLAAGGAILWKSLYAGDLGLHASSHAFPLKAVDEIEHLGVPQWIFADYGWGGVVIYRFYPHAHVFIDTRSTLYGNNIALEYQAVLSGLAGWEKILIDWDVDLLLLDHEGGTKPMPHIAASERWHCVYWDDQAMVFVPPRYLADRPRVYTWPLSNPSAATRILGDRGLLAERLEPLTAELRRKVERDADCSLARHYLATCLLMRRRFAAAAEQWEAVVEAVPRHSLAWFGLGTCYYELGSLQEALRCRRRAWRLDSDTAQFAFGVGEVLVRMGRTEQACRWFERALRLDPEMEAARRALERFSSDGK